MSDKDAQDGIQKVMKMGRRIFGGRETETEYVGPERRSSRRISFRIPVRAGAPGAEMRECRVGDINMRGLSIDSIENVEARRPMDI